MNAPVFMNHAEEYPDGYLATILKEVKTIAMVGASGDKTKFSYGVLRVLHETGYDMIPVNPNPKLTEIRGIPVFHDLKDIDRPVDMVEVFRPKEEFNAIAEQAERLAFSNTFVDLTNDPAALLSAKLAELAPGNLNRVHFTTGGSTAIDSAYRLAHLVQAARGYPEKTHVIARRRSYHGSTYISMSIGKRDGDRIPEFPYETKTIHHVSPPFFRRPGDEEALTAQLVAEFETKIAAIGPEKVAAFFAEPIQASGGVIVSPDGYLKAMAEVCRKHDILFIADEVVTGFGRIGHWFASYDEYGVIPDMICCAKGLSSGYQPIGAVIFSDDLWDAMSGDRWFTNGFTYAGHPVACAAALKNIEIMEREDLLANARSVGAYFQDGLESLRDINTVIDTRGKGLIGCVESSEAGVEGDIGKMISDVAERHGLMVRPLGANNVMSPPLTITRDEVDFVIETLRTSILEMNKALGV